MTNEMKIKKALESVKGDYSLKSRASAMRKLFKDLFGYNNRRLSIKSAGSSIRIDILDSDIKLNQIKDIAEQFKMVSYDERSGEILSGGNIFVFVDYESSLKNNLYEQCENISEMIAKSAETKGSTYRTDSELEIYYNPQFKHVTIFDKENNELFSTSTYNLTGTLVSIILYEKVTTLEDILSLKKI